LVSGLAADLPCGTSAAAGEKPTVGCADADNKNPDLQDVGATGLEPATRRDRPVLVFAG
jgi:hypothetical protein